MTARLDLARRFIALACNEHRAARRAGWGFTAAVHRRARRCYLGAARACLTVPGSG